MSYYKKVYVIMLMLMLLKVFTSKSGECTVALTIHFICAIHLFRGFVGLTVYINIYASMAYMIYGICADMIYKYIYIIINCSNTDKKSQNIN